MSSLCLSTSADAASDVLLDPPNVMIDASCRPADAVLQVSSTASARRDSVGTLTSWQLLAQQVGDNDVEDDSRYTLSALKCAPSELLCSPRSASWSSGNRVPARPHHAFYKEYKLLEAIGKGAFGTVSIVVRRSDGKQLVAKEIASGQAALASLRQREAIMGEVHVLASMKHPNIVKYHDCFMDANFLIIIMEHCNAGDLAGLIKRQGCSLLPEHHVMFLFIQICLAMHQVHGLGVLHRDLKTSNILAQKPTSSSVASTAAPAVCNRLLEGTSSSLGTFDGLPILKLADFGVAKAGCDTDGSMAGTTVGTPHYLSPEMCDGKRYGRKTDVWALGCILYEVACLRRAFEASSIGGIYRKIAAAEYAPLPACYSSGLHSLVGSLLTKDPKLRLSITGTLNLPYVRQHLGAYLDWARSIPEAQPEVLLTCMSQSPSGFISPRTPASRTTSGLLQDAKQSSVTSGNSGNSGNSAHKAEGLAAGICVLHSTTPSMLLTPPPLVLHEQRVSTAPGISPSSRAPTWVVPLQASPTAADTMPEYVLPRKQSRIPPSGQQPVGSPFVHNWTPGATSLAPNAPQSPPSPPGSTMETPTAISAAAVGRPLKAESVDLISCGSAAPWQQLVDVGTKLDPFCSAIAAVAAVLGHDVSAADNKTAAVTASGGPHIMLSKRKLSTGCASHSLDIWASTKEHSSGLIPAVHNSMDFIRVGSQAGAPSSAHSSPTTTRRSMQDQLTQSLQQQPHASYQVQQPISPAMGVSCFAVDSSSVVTSTITQPVTAEHDQVAVPPPWLTTPGPNQCTLQCYSTFDCDKPSSLQEWHASGDSRVLQHLQPQEDSAHTRQKTHTHPCSTLKPLSPLGCADLTGKALLAQDEPTRIAPRATVCGMALSSDSAHGCNPHSSNWSEAAASVNGPVAHSVHKKLAANSHKHALAASDVVTMPLNGCTTGLRDEQLTGSTKQLVSVLAAANSSAGAQLEDDMPLAVMVKQCLSGSSFLYTRHTVPVQAQQQLMQSDAATHSCTTPPNMTSSGSLARSSGASKQDGFNLHTQAAADMVAEQQQMVQLFNVFRAGFGIKQGPTSHCLVTHTL